MKNKPDNKQKVDLDESLKKEVKNSLHMNDERENAEILRIKEDTERIKAEREKAEFELEDLKRKLQKPWYRKQEYFRIIISVFLGVSILGFYLDYLILPVAERKAIKLDLENSRKEMELFKKEQELRLLSEDLDLKSQILDLRENELQLERKINKERQDSIIIFNNQIQDLLNRIQIKALNSVTKKEYQSLEDSIQKVINKISITENIRINENKDIFIIDKQLKQDELQRYSVSSRLKLDQLVSYLEMITSLTSNSAQKIEAIGYARDLFFDRALIEPSGFSQKSNSKKLTVIQFLQEISESKNFELNITETKELSPLTYGNKMYSALFSITIKKRVYDSGVVVYQDFIVNEITIILVERNTIENGKAISYYIPLISNIRNVRTELMKTVP